MFIDEDNTVFNKFVLGISSQDLVSASRLSSPSLPSVCLPRSVMAKVDDEMLRHYCNEDLFLMEVQHRDADSYDLTLIELTGVEH